MNLKGYELADEIYDHVKKDRIKKDKNYDISNKDMIRVISFWGFREEKDNGDTIDFLRYLAGKRIKKIIKKAVKGDYRMLNAFLKELDRCRGNEFLSALMRGKKE